jgi:hypothetical protein
MKKEISKKLLSEVLEINEKLISDVSIDEFECRYYDVEDDKYYSCNIYELAHKCKEWALSKGYILMSKPRTSSSFATCVFCKNGKCDYEDDLWNDFRADTEPEAIIKACEWIMNKLQESK